MNEQVLVTGGAGFIGRHLVQQLIEREKRVRVVERPGAKVDHLPLDRIDIAFADVRDRDAVARVVIGCNQVYHLAANPQLWTHRKGQFRQVNYLGTVNVIESALAVGARIVHVSTESILTRARLDHANGHGDDVPLSEVIGPYCRSKWHAEQFAFRIARSGASIIVVNPTLPIGPGDLGRSPPTQMILDAALGKRTAYLDAELNLIDVRDVAAGLIAAMEHGQPGRRYMLGHENWTIRRLFDWIARQCGVPGPRWQIPYPVALTAAMVSEWIADVFTHRIPAASVTGVRLTRRVMRFDPRRCHEELGIAPRPVENSLKEMLAWFHEMAWLKT